METWIISLILAVLCALIGWWRSRPTANLARQSAPPIQVQGEVMNYRPNIPANWDEREISSQLATIQDRPQVLAHYIDSLKQRFILKTEDKTAQSRTRFIRTHIEQLELAKQYQGLTNDLRAMESEQENRLLRLQSEKRELESANRQAATLDGLKLEKDRLAIEVEIAELKAKKRAVGKTPKAAESKLTSDQERRLKRMEIEDRLRQLEQDEQAALRNGKDEEDRIRIQNMYSDAREDLREQLAKTLI